MTQEFKTERAEQYANGKSSASVFRENHIKDYLAGYEQALEDVQEKIDQSETYQKGFEALQEAVLKSAERNKELVDALESILSHYGDVIKGDYSSFSLRSDIDKAKELITKATTI